MSTALLPRALGYLLMSMSRVGSDPSMDLATVSVSLSPPSSSVASEKSAERGPTGGERARGGTARVGPSGPRISSAVLVASTRLEDDDCSQEQCAVAVVEFSTGGNVRGAAAARPFGSGMLEPSPSELHVDGGIGAGGVHWDAYRPHEGAVENGPLV